LYSNCGFNRRGDWANTTIAGVPGAIGIQLPGIQLPWQRKTDAMTQSGHWQPEFAVMHNAAHSMVG
jgi:hypothetical protein